MSNYYSKRKPQPTTDNHQQQQEIFYDLHQGSGDDVMPIGVRKNSAGNLVTTFDQSNTRNPISTSLVMTQPASQQQYILPKRIDAEPPPQTKNAKHIQHYHNKQHKHLHQGPQDYLIWSIANVFIFFILALPALFFSVQTREMKRAQNYERAKYFSKRSLILNILASILGLLGITLAIIFRFALYHLFVQNDVQSFNVPLNGSG